jgi:hypothetical protein
MVFDFRSDHPEHRRGVRTAAAILIAALPAFVAAQDKKPDSPSTLEMEVTGCVKGSVLTDLSTRRWRLRGPKAMMKELKKQDRKQVRLVGTSKDPTAGFSRMRVGKSNIYIGGATNTTQREPLPDLPTIDVESFEPTGENCQ